MGYNDLMKRTSHVTSEVSFNKPTTNADRIRAMTDEELADEYIRIYKQLPNHSDSLAWLRD